ncbi:MAG TPA: ABC transporter permease subunit [Chitinophagales bacterium]|nr:ABC transporter permease subunit [Chitinophagales bacterium]
MKNIITIFRKEFIDVTRDKRTLYMMLLMPLLLYPVLITVVTNFIESQQEKADSSITRIGIIDTGGEMIFDEYVATTNQTVITHLAIDTITAKQLVTTDSFDVIYWFPSTFVAAIDSILPTSYNYYYNSTNNEYKVDGIRKMDGAFQSELGAKRIAQLQINPIQLNPAISHGINLASEREQTGAIIGGMIPYFFMIFCLLGCMYPAIDLAAGEKERGTLETLLVSSASRVEIYVGKFLVVALSGFISAISAIIGMLIAAKINFDSSDMASGGAMAELMNGILEPGTILQLLLILLPLNIFFAAVLLMLSIYARSFKEAQSYISPLMIIVVLPAIIGMMPGVRLDNTTAFIPILNVSLGAKEIISGIAQPMPLILTYVSLLVYAGISLIISVRFFNNEKNIMRG